MVTFINKYTFDTARNCLLALAMLFLLHPAVRAQDDLLGGPIDQVGIIPGTTMTRDEFRARAGAQLSAIALNAEVFWLVHARYPESFSELKSSAAWNLDITNMFNGRPIGSIYFEPLPEDMIPGDDLNMPLVMSMPQALPGFATPPDGGGGSGDNGGDGSGAQQPIMNIPEPVVMRVDPGKVGNYSGGEVFMYSHGDMLQLILYAPDGNYHEIFNAAPNRYWQSQMRFEGGVAYWPDDLFVAQLLFFAEDLLPQSYNHMLFMSDQETLPVTELNNRDAAQRLAMATELGITFLNPYEKRAIAVSGEYQPGDFVQSDLVSPVPLQICLVGNRILTRDLLLDQQRAASRSGADPKQQPATKPGRPPLGGSR